MKNPRVSRRKEIKIRVEINEKETKETLAKINKTKIWFYEKINRQTISQTHQEERRRIKSTKLEMKMKTQQPKPMGFSKSSAKGKVHSNTSLPQKTREKSNK